MTDLWNSVERLNVALRVITIFGIIIGAVFALAAYVVNDRIGSLQGKRINSQQDSINNQSKMLGDQNSTISNQNGMITRLQSDLQNMSTKAAELESQAQKAKQGVTDEIYDFNGARHQSTGPGKIKVTAGIETTIFQNMFNLEKEKRYDELLSVSESQITSTPNWLTPYLFSGVAYANLNKLELAKERLTFVVERAGSDSNYEGAKRMLSQIEAYIKK